jgi:leader peptidase (prepilin peptidase)/N-methyltransferase
MGDVKMMAMVGAFLGYRLAFLTIFAGSLVGNHPGIFLILFRKSTCRPSWLLAFSGREAAALSGVPRFNWYLRVPR